MNSTVRLDTLTGRLVRRGLLQPGTTFTRLSAVEHTQRLAAIGRTQHRGLAAAQLPDVEVDVTAEDPGPASRALPGRRSAGVLPLRS